MSALLKTRAIDNATDRSGGNVWNRLHSEREDICEALIKEPFPGSKSGTALSCAGTWHKDLLQARLCKIDDALDRLMSGSYGNCSKCDRWIEDTKLDFDPAIALCLECWERQQRQNRNDTLIAGKDQPREQANPGFDSLDQSIDINSSLPALALQALAPFDTICVRTRNSDYRIFLLDPGTGRALVEGGGNFVEPLEAKVSGSSSPGGPIKNGEIRIGYRMEMWVNNRLVSTSPVQSFQVEHLVTGTERHCV